MTALDPAEIAAVLVIVGGLVCYAIIAWAVWKMRMFALHGQMGSLKIITYERRRNL